MNRYVYSEDYRHATDIKTGEILNMQQYSFAVPEGTIIKTITPAEQERNNELHASKYVIEKSKKDFKKWGAFYFALQKETTFDGLKPADVTRLVYLLTFADYNGKLRKTQRKVMMKSDLQKVLKLSRSATAKFKKVIIPDYIIENDNGELEVANKEIFYRGELGNLSEHRFYQRVYFNSIHELYENSKPHLHKHIGYVLLMLPYINIHWNVLTEDSQFEVNWDNINPMTFERFGELIGVSKENLKKLWSVYKDIKISADDEKQERLFAPIYRGSIMRSYMMINPRVFYGGLCYENVEEIIPSFT